MSTINWLASTSRGDSTHTGTRLHAVGGDATHGADRMGNRRAVCGLLPKAGWTQLADPKAKQCRRCNQVLLAQHERLVRKGT